MHKCYKGAALRGTPKTNKEIDSVNEDRFHLERADIEGIEVVHVSTGGRFFIPIRNRELREVFCTIRYNEITKTYTPDLGDHTLPQRAKSFAEAAARARALID